MMGTENGKSSKGCAGPFMALAVSRLLLSLCAAALLLFAPPAHASAVAVYPGALPGHENGAGFGEAYFGADGPYVYPAVPEEGSGWDEGVPPEDFIMLALLGALMELGLEGSFDLGGFLEGGGQPPRASFTPDGDAEILDNFFGNDGIEFLTFVTPDGHVFYMVIDRNRPYGNVYLLRPVRSADLLPLAEDYYADVGAGDITNAELLMVLYELFAQGALASADVDYFIEAALAPQQPEEPGRPFPVFAVLAGFVSACALAYVFAWPKIKEFREGRMGPQEEGEFGGSEQDFDKEGMDDDDRTVTVDDDGG